MTDARFDGIRALLITVRPRQESLVGALTEAADIAAFEAGNVADQSAPIAALAGGTCGDGAENYVEEAMES
jgi:hypothetical protein